MEFHEKLQSLRKQKGLTQEELAAFLFVSRAAVSKWESARGYPGIDSLKALAKFFGITIDGWIGAFVSIFMLKSAIEIALESSKRFYKAKSR